LNWIVSSPAAPAAHSPAAPPDAVFVFEAVIASRSVQAPSFAAVSETLLTVIVAAEAKAERRTPTRTPMAVRPGFLDLTVHPPA
jgi:hypothetical protein